MEPYYSIASHWRRRHCPPRLQEQLSRRRLGDPWPLLSPDLQVYLLKAIIRYSGTGDLVSLVSAFPMLNSYVSIVSDDLQLHLAPFVKAISIWDVDSDVKYDPKPVVVFMLRRLGYHPWLDTYQLIQDHSCYFTPGCFITVEVPNTVCFQLEILKMFASKSNALLLPPVVFYDRDLYRNYQCLDGLHSPTSSLYNRELFKERVLVRRPEVLPPVWTFDSPDRGTLWNTIRRTLWRTHPRVKLLDVKDVDLLQLHVPIKSVNELRVRITRRCTEDECSPRFVPLKTNYNGEHNMFRIIISYHGNDVPFLSFRGAVGRRLPSMLEAGYSPGTSFTLVNLDWSINNFFGEDDCRFRQRHKQTEEQALIGHVDGVRRRNAVIDGPIDCMELFSHVYYIGVPIETILRSYLRDMKHLTWKRLTRTKPGDRVSRGSNVCGPVAPVPYNQETIHPNHTIKDNQIQLYAITMDSLHIWSHLVREESFPVFRIRDLRTLVLVALEGSEMTWNLSKLLVIRPPFPIRFGFRGLTTVILAALGDFGSPSDALLTYDKYECVVPTVIHLTVIGYTLDVIPGNVDIDKCFEALQSLSIDVRNLPKLRSRAGDDRLYIIACADYFPMLKHLHLWSGYMGRQWVPQSEVCPTEVYVGKKCESVSSSTALAAYPFFINGQAMEVGDHHSIRESSWRVTWVRSGESFVYSDTRRHPIDPEIREMGVF